MPGSLVTAPRAMCYGARGRAAHPCSRRLPTMAGRLCRRSPLGGPAMKDGRHRSRAGAGRLTFPRWPGRAAARKLRF